MNESASTPIASSRLVDSKSNPTGLYSAHDGNILDSPLSSKDVYNSDLTGKLSLTLRNLRHIKEQLANTEEELHQTREEKEKYTQEHSKLYSQMTAIRTRCTLLENQCTKKTGDLTKLQEKYEMLEMECSKLRKIISEDSSKQTLRNKSLESQVSLLKSELNAKCALLEQTVRTFQREKEALTDSIEPLKESYKNEAERLHLENESLQKGIQELNLGIEESRLNNINLSSEKSSILQEFNSLKKEYKYLLKNKGVVEMEEGLAELETERSNAKMAIKKAMSVLDEVDQLKIELHGKDQLVLQLEAALKAIKSPRLPSIHEIVNQDDEDQLPSAYDRVDDASKSIEERMGAVNESRSRLLKLLGKLTSDS